MLSITRRAFMGIFSKALVAAALSHSKPLNQILPAMNKNSNFDVIIVGGSYAGLAAAMALGRALRKVLVLDSGLACNRQTPQSHNFITHDGRPPAEITAIAKEQVAKYSTVQFVKTAATSGKQTANGFELETTTGMHYMAKKLLFAAGIKDMLPDIPGFAQCWGISVLHCPYCHGYEVKNQRTGILGNGDYAFDFGMLISNWTKDLTIYTNGTSTLSHQQSSILQQHGIGIVEKQIAQLIHNNGRLQQLAFTDGTQTNLPVLYSKVPFVQHCDIPQSLGCALTNDGYIVTDPLQKTTVHGIYACGDNTNRMRTVANAVAAGTTAGMMLNKELLMEQFGQ